MSIINRQAVNQFKKFFGFKDLPKEAGQKLEELLNKFSDDIVGEAVMHWMDTHRPTLYNFPTVAQMESALVEAQQRLERRKRELHKTEKAIPSSPNKGFVSAISELVQKKLEKLTQKKLDKKKDYPIEEYAHDLEELDGEYPYLGLKVAAVVNRMYAEGKLSYEEQGYILRLWEQKGIEKARDLIRQQWQHPGYIGRLLEIRLERWQKISWGKPFAP